MSFSQSFFPDRRKKCQRRGSKEGGGRDLTSQNADVELGPAHVEEVEVSISTIQEEKMESRRSKKKKRGVMTYKAKIQVFRIPSERMDTG